MKATFVKHSTVFRLDMHPSTLHLCLVFTLATWQGCALPTPVEAFSTRRSPLGTVLDRPAATVEECARVCLSETSIPCRYIKFHAASRLCLLSAFAHDVEGFARVHSLRQARDATEKPMGMEVDIDGKTNSQHGQPAQRSSTDCNGQGKGGGKCGKAGVTGDLFIDDEHVDLKSLAREIRHLKHIVFSVLLTRDVPSAPEGTQAIQEELISALENAHVSLPKAGDLPISEQALKHYADRVQKSQHMMEKVLRIVSKDTMALQHQENRADSALELLMKVLVSRLSKDRTLSKDVQHLNEAVANLQAKVEEGSSGQPDPEERRRLEGRVRQLEGGVAGLASRLRQLEEGARLDKSSRASMAARMDGLETFKKESTARLARLALTVSNASREIAQIGREIPKKADRAETQRRQEDLTGQITKLQSGSSHLAKEVDRQAQAISRLSQRSEEVAKAVGTLSRSSTEELSGLKAKLQGLTERVNAVHSAIAATHNSTYTENMARIPDIVDRQLHTERELKDIEDKLHGLEKNLRDLHKALENINMSTEKLSSQMAASIANTSRQLEEEKKQQKQQLEHTLSILLQKKNKTVHKLEGFIAALAKQEVEERKKLNKLKSVKNGDQLENMVKEVEETKIAAKTKNTESLMLAEESKLASINSQIAGVRGDIRKAQDENDRAERLKSKAAEARLQSKLSLQTVRTEERILRERQLASSFSNKTATKSTNTTELKGKKAEATKNLQRAEEALERKLERYREDIDSLQSNSSDSANQRLAKNVQRVKEIVEVENSQYKVLESMAKIAQLNSELAQAEGDKRRALQAQDKANDLRNRAEEVKVTL